MMVPHAVPYSGDGWVDTAVFALFGACLIAVFFIDLEHYIIPDQLNLFGIGLGIAYNIYRIVTKQTDWKTSILGKSIPLPESVVGILICGVAFLAVAIISYYILRKEAMGGGDIKLAAAMGAVFGVQWAMASFFIAIFLGAVVGIALMIKGRKGRKDYVPFGPFMVVGALAVIFFGDGINHLWNMYLRYAGL